MIWFLLWIIWTFFGECNNIISKQKLTKHHHFTMGVISTLFGVILFGLMIGYKIQFTDFSPILNPASIFLLTIRIFLEIFQSYVSLLAIKYSDRSAFSIIRVITLPLLLIVDIILGYNFSVYSYIGIILIVFSFIFFQKWSYKQIVSANKYALLSAINAVLTISLFKYSITYYWNSPEVDQIIILSSILIFFIIQNYRVNKISAIWLIFKEKIFILQAFMGSLSSLILTYSYVYLNASEATTLKRAWEMFWAILAGMVFFKEKQIAKKLFFAICLSIWLFIMIL